MAGLTLDTVALRTLAKRVNEVLRANADDLAAGNGIVQNDLVATGGNYFSSVAYVRALHDVLEWCKQVEDDLIRGKQ